MDKKDGGPAFVAGSSQGVPLYYECGFLPAWLPIVQKYRLLVFDREGGERNLGWDLRIIIYRWHDQDYESMDFSATVEDFNQFDETRPEEWFDVAAKMIQGRV